MAYVVRKPSSCIPPKKLYFFCVRLTQNSSWNLKANKELISNSFIYNYKYNRLFLN